MLMMHVIVNYVVIQAFVMFQITKLGFERNWFKAVGVIRDNAFSRYLYSIYFTTSTIFTAGYGDVVPRN